MDNFILRHDDVEAALPHQIDLPEGWGLRLLDPVGFEVTLPKWCPLDDDTLVALHWWGSLSAHLHVLLKFVEAQDKVHYRLDKALRLELGHLRNVYGGSVSASISVAGLNSRAHVCYDADEHREHREMSYWTMAVQVAFGLLSVQAATKGRKGDGVAAIEEIYELVVSAFRERIGDGTVSTLLISACTGTENGTVEEKLAQWNAAKAQASEGMPDVGGAP